MTEIHLKKTLRERLMAKQIKKNLNDLFQEEIAILILVLVKEYCEKWKVKVLKKMWVLI